MPSSERKPDGVSQGEEEKRNGWSGGEKRGGECEPGMGWGREGAVLVLVGWGGGGFYFAAEFHVMTL